LVSRCEDFIRQLPPGSRLEPVKPRPVAIDGSGWLGALAGVRGRIDRLRAEAIKVQGARASSDDARAQIRAMVHSLAKGGTPKVMSERGEVRIFKWDPQTFQGPPSYADLVSLVAWAVGPEVIVDKLAALVQADEDGLPLDERKQRLAEIEEDIVILEIEEEQVICAAASQGAPLTRRIDARAQGVLQVRVVA
jgi:hypothetical protein